MKKILVIAIATFCSWLGWWVGYQIGLMTGFILSMICFGLGMYYGRRLIDF